MVAIGDVECGHLRKFMLEAADESSIPYQEKFVPYPGLAGEIVFGASRDRLGEQPVDILILFEG